MAMSDVIAAFIMDTLRESKGAAELQRSELAQRFSCAPSQINYVISTRFSPEHGYIVESRRGGGGYIRIQRVQYDPNTLIMNTVNAIGDELDAPTAAAFISNLYAVGTLDAKTARLISSAISEAALRPLSAEARNVVRASILKQILVNYSAIEKGR